MRQQLKEIQEEKALAYREEARGNYRSYVEYVHRGRWKRAPHLDLICEILGKVERGLLSRVILSLPPRHGKSMSVTETFPSWFIGKYAERRVIEVSYGAGLAKKFGRANRRKIEEFGAELFNVHVSQENRSVTDWGIRGARGGMISAGIDGAITGEGADLLIIDDPIKNRKEAESETYRKRIWEEWQDTLLSRLHPGAAVVIIMTRWHENDLVGQILHEDIDKEWTLVNLPAIAEKDDILARPLGAPLWPDHGFDEKWAEKTKKSVGSRTWESLFQGRPTVADGSIFLREWWRYYNSLPPVFDEIVLSWDMAFKDHDDSDFVVGQAWGKIRADRYLLDQVRGRMNFPKTLRAVVEFKNKWPSAQRILIEDKANGPAVISTLQRDIQGVIPVEPEGGKIVRAHAVTGQIESGNVFLPSKAIAPWIDDFINEMTAFPNGANDDQVDAATQALTNLAEDDALAIWERLSRG